MTGELEGMDYTRAGFPISAQNNCPV